MATIIDGLQHEATFLPNAFRTSESVTGIYALVRRLQNLFIMEPGTNPNCTKMGIGIGLYLEEIADEITIGEITNHVNNQVKQFIPNNIIRSIDISYITLKDSQSIVMLAKMSVVDPASENAKKIIGLTFLNDTALPYETSRVSTIKSDVYY